MLEEAATASLTYNGDAPMPQTRVTSTPEDIAAIPEPWAAHVPSFVVDTDEGPGCACCGPGVAWCECRCGQRSPRYACARHAYRWHVDHVLGALQAHTAAS